MLDKRKGQIAKGDIKLVLKKAERERHPHAGTVRGAKVRSEHAVHSLFEERGKVPGILKDPLGGIMPQT